MTPSRTTPARPSGGLSRRALPVLLVGLTWGCHERAARPLAAGDPDLSQAPPGTPSGPASGVLGVQVSPASDGLEVVDLHYGWSVHLPNGWVDVRDPREAPTTRLDWGWAESGGKLRLRVLVGPAPEAPAPSLDDTATFLSTASWPLPKGCARQGQVRTWTRWEPGDPGLWVVSTWAGSGDQTLQWEVRLPERGFAAGWRAVRAVLDGAYCLDGGPA